LFEKRLEWWKSSGWKDIILYVLLLSIKNFHPWDAANKRNWTAILLKMKTWVRKTQPLTHHWNKNQWPENVCFFIGKAKMQPWIFNTRVTILHLNKNHSNKVHQILYRSCSLLMEYIKLVLSLKTLRDPFYQSWDPDSYIKNLYFWLSYLHVSSLTQKRHKNSYFATKNCFISNSIAFSFPFGEMIFLPQLFVSHSLVKECQSLFASLKSYLLSY